jgi:flagellar hook-length control protein FliK
VTPSRGDVATALLPTGTPEFEPQEILFPQARVPVAEKPGDFVILARAGFSGIAKDAAPNAAALSLLQQAGRDPAPAAKAATAFRAVQGEDVHTNTPPPPFRGALPSAQPVASASIAPETPLAPAAHHLLADTDAAIARHTLLQVASLPDRIDALPQPAQNNDTTGPRWNFEVPFATPQGTAMAQFEISRDGSGSEAETASKAWRARFTIDVEPTGPVHALIALVGEKTSVRMWAERPATAEKLRAGSAELSRALAQAELNPGDIVVRDGTPPQPQATSSGHFLDRAL